MISFLFVKGLGIGILPGFVHLLRPYVGGQIGEGSQERADDFLFVRERGADDFPGQVEVVVGQGHLEFVQGDARIVQQTQAVLEDFQHVEPDVGHEILGDQDEDHFHVTDPFLIVLGHFDDIPWSLDHEGFLPYFIRIEVHVHREMPFFQIENDEPVEADGILEHPQDGFVLFYALSAHFADD